MNRFASVMMILAWVALGWLITWATAGGRTTITGYGPYELGTPIAAVLRVNPSLIRQQGPTALVR